MRVNPRSVTGAVERWNLCDYVAVVRPIDAAGASAKSYAAKPGDSTSDRDRKAKHAVKEDLEKKIKPAMKAALAKISKVLE